MKPSFGTKILKAIYSCNGCCNHIWGKFTSFIVSLTIQCVENIMCRCEMFWNLLKKSPVVDIIGIWKYIYLLTLL
jgi:hypothetical protein